MDQHQLEMISKDEAEARDFSVRFIIKIKLLWYFVSRPILNIFLKNKIRSLSPKVVNDPVFARVNVFLNGDGGMFKEYVYKICNQLRSLSGSRVLVPGIGYARNLLQLAAWQPKEIVAFDLYEYPEAWSMMTRKLMEQFGVPVTFYKGNFDALPKDKIGKFDFVISDAVLEHVPDMQKFSAESVKLLKDGGIFYASFGPLWYGPCGDHVTWGPQKLFDHLLLPTEEYDKQLRDSELKASDHDSCDAGFMIREKLFSYLHAKDYLDYLEQAGFKILDLRSKIQPLSLRLFTERPDISSVLDNRGEPAFDRFSGGLYIWAKKP